MMEDTVPADEFEDETEPIPPNMQMDEGVAPQDVECKKGLELVLKASDGSAACVKPSTKELLIARGLAVS